MTLLLRGAGCPVDAAGGSAPPDEIVRPNFTQTDDNTASVLHGAATRWQALSDQSDTSYLTEGSGISYYGGGTTELYWAGSCAAPTLPNNRVLSWTVSGRASTNSATTLHLASLRSYNGSPPGGDYATVTPNPYSAGGALPGTGVITTVTLGPFTRIDGGTFNVSDVIGDGVNSGPGMSLDTETAASKLYEYAITLHYAPAGTYTDSFYSGNGVFSWPWVCPPGVTSVIVETVGYGGTAAGTGTYASLTGSGASGGGGGGYEKRTLAVTPGTTYTSIIGHAGGSAVDSAFVGDDGTCSATHGSDASASVGGAGGSGSGSGGSGAVVFTGGVGAHANAGALGAAGGGAAGATGNGGDASGTTAGVGNSPGGNGGIATIFGIPGASKGGGGAAYFYTGFPSLTLVGGAPGVVRLTYTLP